MIQLNKNYSLPERLAEFIPIKIVSVGGAGLNALDRIVLDGLERADVVAINTDVNSLTSSVATRKVQLGRNVSRGLGAGGDPDVGYQAALESADEIREALTDSHVIFICAGLGGGTGSGAAPYIAQAARESGALVIAFVTLPFGFEGKRRNTQAREALERLSEFAHAVVLPTTFVAAARRGTQRPICAMGMAERHFGDFFKCCRAWPSSCGSEQHCRWLRLWRPAPPNFPTIRSE